MTQFLQNTVCGTVLILAVAVLRGALKDRLLPEARLALWAVCLFRLFTPAAPTSALSFWGLFRRGAQEVPVSAPMPAAVPNAEMIVPAATVGAVSTAPIAPAAPAEAGVSWGAILAAVWIAVGVTLAARYVLAYVRTSRAVECAIPLGREDARYAALPKCARLREGPMEGAPLTFGVARPTVVLPPGLEGADLACVLAHEGVHVRRRDNLWHYATAAALTVFWWDPAVWLMARLIRRDVELSCDRAAVRRLGADRRAEYANALVTLSTQAEGGAFCHGFGPKRTEERIISVMKYRKATVTGIALTLALVLAVTVGFASNPETDMPDEESTTSSAPAPAVWTCSFGPEGELLSLNISLDYLEELLAGYAADGSIAEEGAASFLAEAKAASWDGVMVRWDFPENSGLYTDRGSPERPEFNIYRMDGDGNKVYLSLVEMLAAFPFPSPSASISSSDDYAGTPTKDDFVCFDSTSDPDVILREYKTMLERRVAQGKLTQAEADELLTNMETLIEKAKNGEIEGLMFNKQADGEVVYCIGNQADTEADDQTEEPQVGIDVYYNGTEFARLRYDAEKGVWIDRETGEEYLPDEDGYLDTDDVAGRHDEPDTEADDQTGEEPQPDDDIVIYDPDDPGSNMLVKYKALLERVVAQGGRTQAEADKMLADMEALIERAKNGEIKRLAFNKQANGEVTYIVKAADFT